MKKNKDRRKLTGKWRGEIPRRTPDFEKRKMKEIQKQNGLKTFQIRKTAKTKTKRRLGHPNQSRNDTCRQAA
jgi:hypothetical protein